MQISDAGDTVNVTYAYDGLHDMIYETNTLAASGTVATTDFYYSGQQAGLEADPRLPSSPTDDATAVGHQFVYSPRYVDSPILDTQTTYTVVFGSWSSAANTYYFLDGCQLQRERPQPIPAASSRSVTSIPPMEWRRSTTLIIRRS